MHLPFAGTVKQYCINRKRQQIQTAGTWTFSQDRWNMIYNEGDDWDLHYAPVNLKGKTILDVGAGEGETAKFFIEHGVKKVVCIENQSQRIKLLRYNQKRHPQIVALEKSFDLFDLKMPHDFLKMDIEGYEEMLLNITLATPAVIEIHGLQLRDKFSDKGYLIKPHKDCEDYWTCYGYWNIPPNYYPKHRYINELGMYDHEKQRHDSQTNP